VINGAHVVLYSSDADADRSFISDTLGLRHVDVGGGWLIFDLPPSELAVHPADDTDTHELFLMCDQIEATVKELTAKGVEFTEPRERTAVGSADTTAAAEWRSASVVRTAPCPAV
jgi:catechol 2,3-dioxygenase-like lactoylglutathione lyase family enzyme